MIVINVTTANVIQQCVCRLFYKYNAYSIRIRERINKRMQNWLTEWNECIEYGQGMRGFKILKEISPRI